MGDINGKALVLLDSFSLENGHSCFKVRHPDVRHHSPDEAGPKALFQASRIFRHPIACYYNLISRFMKRVEGKEELLLGPFFPGEKLYIVDDSECPSGGTCCGIQNMRFLRSEAMSSLMKFSEVVK